MAVTTFMSYSEMVAYQTALKDLASWTDSFFDSLMKVKSTYEIGALYTFATNSVASYFQALSNTNSGMLVRYLGGPFNEFYNWHLLTIHPDMRDFLTLLTIIYRLREAINTAASSLRLYN